MIEDCDPQARLKLGQKGTGVSDLPFLVKHGDWFWIVFTVAVAIVLAVIMISARHIKAVLSARNRIEPHRTAVTRDLVDGDAVIAGSFHDDGTIKVDDTFVALDEPKVVVGYRDEQIPTGNAVLAVGRLHRVPLQHGTGYRDNAVAWRLAEGRIYAAKPSRVRARSLRWPGRAAVAIMSLATSYFGLWALGAHLTGEQRREYLPGDGKPLIIDNFDRFSIASSLPHSRTKALEHLEWALERHPYRDSRSVDRRRALARLMYGPCGDLGMLEASGRFDEELAHARQCGTKRDVFDAEVARGDYEAAWADRPAGLDWPYREGMLAIATGRWAMAADEADALAKYYDGEAEKRTYDRDRYEASAAYAVRYRCLSHWLRSLGGDVGEVGKLRELASDAKTRPILCADIVAQTLPAEERKPYLLGALAATKAETVEVTVAEPMVRLQLWLDGQRRDAMAYYDGHGATRSVVDPTHAPLNGRPWLLQLGVESLRGDPANYVLALGGQMFVDIQRGDYSAARRAVDEALTVARTSSDEVANDSAAAMSAALAFREGATQLPHREYWPDGYAVRRGETPDHGMSGFPESCQPRMAEAVGEAQHGDGRALARVLQSCDVFWTFSPGIVLGVLPLVKDGKAELATAIEWWHDGTSSSRSDTPFTTVQYVALRRDLSRLAGDERSAQRWEAVGKRISAQLVDPTRLLALVLWEM